MMKISQEMKSPKSTLSEAATDVNLTSVSFPEEMVFLNQGEETEMELTMVKLKIQDSEATADNQDSPTEEEEDNSEEMEEIRSNVATVSNLDMSSKNVMLD